MEEARKTSCQLSEVDVLNLGSGEAQHENTNQSETKLASTVDEEGNEDSAPDAEELSTSKYSHPVYRELSILNGKINKLNVAQLKSHLRELNLETSGKKSVLQKRLKSHIGQQKLKESGKEDETASHRNLYYDYYLVIDFEATCDEHQNPATYRHEIIEFPAQLVSTKRGQIINHFHSFVRPVINPRLTEFCTNLTGITQDKVNFAPTFPEVLKQFEAWLEERGLTSSETRMTVLTDGSWDMGRFLYQQCSMCLRDMLNHLGMKFQGQPHSGLDDSKNIARVAIRLLKDGANLRVNERINIRKDGIYNPRERVVNNINRHNFEGIKKKHRLVGNDKNDNSSPDQSNLGNVSDSEYDDSKHEESEPLWPDIGNVKEFPDLVKTNVMKET
ncbi:3'-5' exoribonuclease 1 [Portunus trituberculatus]|uniref:3'-5' exoribonuclease 1 n=1 Tax=Portunus trituberculatus TaxID=210409 RepID=A0A5B7DCH8_PORTR|nr:3'-5' exoribonuclease 1 [Portunus trituberculatus]